MSTAWTALMIGVVIATSVPARADTVCRPTALGATGCPDTGPRPMPRPVYRETARGLEGVQELRPVGPGAPAFVPSRETGKLGGNVLTKGGVGGGRCRADTLGNLICP
jgi:hypothetical protein